ncbi:MAG: hypothetical protein Q4C04_01105 [Clostridia bacterium]|nr:hypothetical protein [Clostridia bacterium]
MNLLFILFLGAIAVYVLYAAISGKGRLYNADFIKEALKAKFHKVMRLMYLALGLVMLLEAAVMAGQTYLFEADDYFVAESYYDANGHYYEITMDEDTETYYQTVLGETTPVRLYTYEEMLEQDFIEVDDSGNVTDIYLYKTSTYPAYAKDSDGNYYFTETYYDADGVRHRITEDDGVYSEKVGGNAETEVIKYTEEEFIATFEFNETDLSKPVLNVTKTNPNSDEDESTTTAAASTSLLSCMGTTTTETNNPTISYLTMAHKSDFLSSISYETFSTLNIVFMVLSLVILVAIFVAIRLMTDKEKKNKARVTNTPASGLPSSAFDFDEDDGEK